MSRLIPAANLCNPCSTTDGSAGTPGAPGNDGADGADGADGVSSFTTVADYSPGAQPVMPAEGAAVTVATTSSTGFISVGQPLFIQTWGTMIVTAIPTAASVTVQNPENSGTGVYASNAAPGTSLAAGLKIVPGGIQGIQGPAVTGALIAANNLNDLTDQVAARNNLSLGSLATLSTINNSQWSGTDLGVVNGGTGASNPTDARSNLGLGSMAIQEANAVNISNGEVNAQIGVVTPMQGVFTRVIAEDDLTVEGKIFTPTTVVQSMLAATALDPNAAKVKVVGQSGAVTLVATPTITTPLADGQRLLIVGTDDTNTVTFQNESALTGTKLKLGAASRALGAGDILELLWDATQDRWLEIHYSNNT